MANFHVLAGPDATPAHIPVRKISVADLKEALAKGVDDFGDADTSSFSGSSTRSSAWAWAP